MFQVNRIINNFYVNEYKQKLEAVEQLLHMKQRKIDEEQRQLDETNEKNTILTEDLIDTDTKRIVATEALTAKKQELRNWSDSHAFSFLRLNNTEAAFL